MGYKPKRRTLRPQFFTSEQVASVSYPARLCFAGLWCIADREGRLEDKPNQIRIHLFPYDTKLDVGKLLQELKEADLIYRYECEGVKVVAIPTFTEHQPVHPNEQRSRLPVIPSNLIASKEKVYPPNGNGNDKGKGNDNDKGGVGGNPDDGIPYSEIISDLNEVLKTNYRATTKETQLGIRRWWGQGFRLEDFKAVHRIKAAEWQHDPKMRIFLRPKTLYGDKFENYLNQIERGQLTSEKDYGPEGGRPF